MLSTRHPIRAGNESASPSDDDNDDEKNSSFSIPSSGLFCVRRKEKTFVVSLCFFLEFVHFGVFLSIKTTKVPDENMNHFRFIHKVILVSCHEDGNKKVNA